MDEGSKDWEPLHRSGERIVAAKGVTLEAAKDILCCAMRDKMINFRLIEIVENKDVVRNVEVPVDLHPADIDWERSCPVPDKPWVRAARHSWWPQRLEVYGPDVTSFLNDRPADMGVLGSAQRPLTVEEQAARKLASHYEKHPNLKNDDAFAWCMDNGFLALTERGFYDRVRPEARRIAKLPVRGLPGPKKSPR